MANEAIKIANEIGNVASNKLLTFNVFTNNMESLRVQPVSEYQTLTSLQAHCVSGEPDNLSEPSRIRSIVQNRSA